MLPVPKEVLKNQVQWIWKWIKLWISQFLSEYEGVIKLGVAIIEDLYVYAPYCSSLYVQGELIAERDRKIIVLKMKKERYIIFASAANQQPSL